MAASLEGRYPFLDLDLVRYAVSLPASTLLHGGEEKGVLRLAAENRLQESLARRPKHGFSAPILPECLRRAVVEGRLEAMNRHRVEELAFFVWPKIQELFKSLEKPGEFADESRVARERIAVFIISVQLMQQMMVGSPHLKVSELDI